MMTKFTDIFATRSAFSSEEECVKVALEHAAQFGWDWASINLLSIPADVEYCKARVAAAAERNKAVDAAWDKYRKVSDAAGDENSKAIAAAFVEYNKTIAAAFARAWFNDGGAA